jgi:hypothetical protein
MVERLRSDGLRPTMEEVTVTIVHSSIVGLLSIVSNYRLPPTESVNRLDLFNNRR